jgi:hypothetical protein
MIEALHCEGLAAACLAIGEDCGMEALEDFLQQLGDASTLKDCILPNLGRENTVELKAALIGCDITGICASDRGNHGGLKSLSTKPLPRWTP